MIYVDDEDYREFNDINIYTKTIEDIVGKEKSDYYKTIYQGKGRRTVIQIGDLHNDGRYSVIDSAIYYSLVIEETKTTCFYEDYISTQQDVEYYNR